MKVQFLGTAAAEGVPAIFCQCETCKKSREAGGRSIRRRSGCVINDTIMIDFPPDVYPLSLELGLDLCEITDVFITHSHADHFTPSEILLRMPGCYAVFEHEVAPLNLYGNEETKQIYRDAMVREFNCHEVDFIHYHDIEYFVPRKISNGLSFTYLPAHHKLDEKAGIFLIEEEGSGHRFLYGHDTGWFPDATWKFLEEKKLNCISLDCTNCGNYDGGQHMGLPNVLETVKQLKILGCVDTTTHVIVNHFSHNGKSTYDEMCALANPHHITVSYDGMIVTV